MENDAAALAAKLAEIEAKIDKVYVSTEKMRRYALITLVLGILMVVVPLIAIPFLIGPFLQSATIPAGY